jgi:hypothetical protein
MVKNATEGSIEHRRAGEGQAASRRLQYDAGEAERTESEAG